MTDLVPEDRRSGQSRHASFVVRCWVGASGQVRAYLIDAGTGVTYPLADLAALVPHIHWLLEGNTADRDEGG